MAVIDLVAMALGPRTQLIVQDSPTAENSTTFLIASIQMVIRMR